ncbi:MAG: MMPL family transporter [Eubacterium sp.]|nr:MMPL family transporter [Eubacterium sp.]
MYKFAQKVVKFRIPILILAVLLLIPAGIGYFNTGINYDILYYLPDDIETMEGQDILVDEFGTGAFSMMVTEGLEAKEVSALKSEIEDIDNVARVVWYDSLVDISVPTSALPSEIVDAFQTDDGDTNLMIVIFETTSSAEETMTAIEEIRDVAGDGTFLSGMSTIVTDTRILSDKETPVYVLIAVVCSLLVLALTMDSFVVPFLFLASIGMAIVYNLGSNIFLGEISYITKALAAVLQLGVTMDYSIFLWHSYQEQTERFKGDKIEGMVNAVAATASSVFGSSITTVAGFIALCFMSFTLGLDLGVVMAKGVIFGVLCCITILPSMILVFDGLIEKFKHRPLIPSISRISGFVTRHYKALIVIFLCLLPFAIYGNSHVPVYYNLDSSLPEELASVSSQKELQEKFDLSCAHMILADASMESYEVAKMCDEVDDVDGVSAVLGLDSLVGGTIPESMVPDEMKELLESDNWKVILVMSEYQVASDEVSAQIDSINSIIKGYNENCMLVGEAPCTDDLIEITDRDFAIVSAVSIGLVFVIILILFKSITLPIMLVACIEFAIFLNMSLACYMNTTLPFIAQIVIGTIQLGSTVDYAILMTTKYKQYRTHGFTKDESLTKAHETSIESVMVSAFGFFAATFGVALYSDIDMISSLCTLMARGALISMVVVALVVPSLLRVLDYVIIRTSGGFKEVVEQERAERAKTEGISGHSHA